MKWIIIINRIQNKNCFSFIQCTFWFDLKYSSDRFPAIWINIFLSVLFFCFIFFFVFLWTGIWFLAWQLPQRICVHLNAKWLRICLMLILTLTLTLSWCWFWCKCICICLLHLCVGGTCSTFLWSSLSLLTLNWNSRTHHVAVSTAFASVVPQNVLSCWFIWFENAYTPRCTLCICMMLTSCASLKCNCHDIIQVYVLHFLSILIINCRCVPHFPFSTFSAFSTFSTIATCWAQSCRILEHILISLLQEFCHAAATNSCINLSFEMFEYLVELKLKSFQEY